MSIQPIRSVYAAGIIERGGDETLIALPRADSAAERLWQFPRCEVRSDEAPEKALRRFAEETLKMPIEIAIGQPPFPAMLGDTPVEMRYMICHPQSDAEPQPGPYAELRWIRRVHLLEYELDAVSKPVVDWLLAR